MGALKDLYRNSPGMGSAFKNRNMSLWEFAAVEAVLWLLHRTSPGSDAWDACFMLCRYQIIGTDSPSPEDAMLAAAAGPLDRFRYREVWRRSLDRYRGAEYEGLRVFDLVEEGDRLKVRVTDSQVYPIANRLAEWRHLWEDEPDPRPDLRPAQAGAELTADMSRGPAVLRIPAALPVSAVSAGTPGRPKGARPPLRIPVSSLLETAERMARQDPGDCSLRILKNTVLRKVTSTSASGCLELDVSGTVHVAGMVGTGKSTLLRVLCVWCQEQGKHIAAVLPTVTDVLRLDEYLHRFGVSSVPLIGRTGREKYIDRLCDEDTFLLSRRISRMLTPLCPLESLGDSSSPVPPFGREPCLSLHRDGETFCCPWFDGCCGTEMIRTAASAPVVITTPAGYARIRTGRNRELYLQTVLRHVDLVVFDEADSVQRALDVQFLPKISFDDCIGACPKEVAGYMSRRSPDRYRDEDVNSFMALYSRTPGIMRCLVNSFHDCMETWSAVKRNRAASSFSLISSLDKPVTGQSSSASAFPLSSDALKELEAAAASFEFSRREHSPLWRAVACSCDGDDTYFLREWAKKYGADLASDGLAWLETRLLLIIRIIFLQDFLERLGSAYERSHTDGAGGDRMQSVLAGSFSGQQKILPSPPCGYLTGVMLADGDDLILFRQTAFGRSLMNDLPYLRFDENGQPAGPHALLLSGSSWAPGSLMFHVSRPVNYILATALPEKDRFLAGSKLYGPLTKARVSGSQGEERDKSLKQVVDSVLDHILRECRDGNRKVLLVANSYDETETAAGYLHQLLQGRGQSPGICAMVRDGTGPDGTELKIEGLEFIERGDVESFADRKAKILIAPAMAIDRGHNIVDEHGHSVLAAVFFLARPMRVPGEIQDSGCRTAGYIEANVVREQGESALEYSRRLRAEASKYWRILNEDRPQSLAQLNEQERRDLVATMFIQILQIYGRAARVSDEAVLSDSPVKPVPPKIFFADGAFRRRDGDPGGFDFLEELDRYLDSLLHGSGTSAAAQALYGPFIKAYKEAKLCGSF